MTKLLANLDRYVRESITAFDMIPATRKAELKMLSSFVQEKTTAGEVAKLIFICTHNSRRSHLSQIWAQVAAWHYGVPNVQTYSGGTEATAFNPRAVAAVEKAGFVVEKTENEENPRYQVSYANNQDALICFSKKYDDAANPAADFCAIMTCDSADEACPIVFGAAARIPIKYQDPKAFDDTPQETEKYDARCRQIAREMLYAFSLLFAA